MNKIIFIEGISGVGKTTTTTHLSKKLQNEGYKVACYLEGDSNNPLDPFDGAYPRKMPIVDYFETYKQYWRIFMENEIDSDFMIVDGTLLHHQINDLIREYSASDIVIADYLSNLLTIIQPLNPILFYFSSDNVGKRLIQARISRKQSTPTIDKIKFWENRVRVDLFVLEKLPIKTYMINIVNGWDSIPKTITEYITL